MSGSHSVNAASADALIAKDELPPSSKKDTASTTSLEQKRPNSGATVSASVKKPRFTRPISKRRGGAAYTKQAATPSLEIVPRLSFFPIFTSNNGCRSLAETCYTVIRGKDFRLAQNIQLTQLMYAMTISFCNRLVQCGIKYGYAFPDGASRLKQVASGIQLPSILASYIESFGLVELSSSARMVPLVSDYRRMFPPNTFLMTDPAVILQEAEREIPNGDWALDVEWIVDYNAATTRAARSGMNFRVVDNNNLEGRVTQLVSFQPIGDDLLLPLAPQKMSEAEAQLGATYRIRDYTEREEWPGTNKDLVFNAFTAIPFDPRIVFSDVCVAAFRGITVTTD